MISEQAVIAVDAGDLESIPTKTKLDWEEWEAEPGDKWKSSFGSLPRFLQQ